MLFLLSLSLTLFLASFQIGGVIQPLPGVRISNVNFIFAVIILGVVYIFSEASAQGRRAKRICVLLCVLFNIFTFSNGAAWAVDTDSCIQVSDLGYGSSGKWRPLLSRNGHCSLCSVSAT